MESVRLKFEVNSHEKVLREEVERDESLIQLKKNDFNLNHAIYTKTLERKRTSNKIIFNLSEDSLCFLDYFSTL